MEYDVKVYMLGTGSPRPNLDRYTTIQALTFGNTTVMIDCGENATVQLLRADLDPARINYLFFTHLHSDHVFGYPRFLLGGWGLGRKQLTVIGPQGTRAFHNKMIDLFKEDIEYRLSVGFSEQGILDVNVIEIEKPGALPCDIPAKITVEKMDHTILTYAYRFDIGSKSVVFSGDTAPIQGLVELATGADVLIHDACLSKNPRHSNPDDPEAKKIWLNLHKGHCSPLQAAQTAAQAGVKKLILTHFPARIDEQQVYEEAAQAFNNEIIVAKDLQVINV
jgi:ribonuclease BN (tRNA processing enzyme)